mmetsp:Transcript_35342/g.89479  ORF Transcript_35342/g.89479 Transcript_35342/m.89479 type:complete len:275 (+) Transcript_35342:2008-2832(+)
MEISLVVGRMPSARNFLPSSALITLLFPLLNSPTTTTRNGSSSCLTASRSSDSSCRSGTTSSRKAITRASVAFSTISRSPLSAPCSLRAHPLPPTSLLLPGAAGALTGTGDATFALVAACCFCFCDGPCFKAAMTWAAACAGSTAPLPPDATEAAAGSSRRSSAMPSICCCPCHASARRSGVVAAAEVMVISTGMALPERCCDWAADRSSAAGGPPSSAVTSTRFAPSAAALMASAALVTMRPTKPPPDAASMRLATTVGTPCDVSRTPSASAA